MADAVVIGGGPGAVRASGALRRAGRRVILLQRGPAVGGLAFPEVPLGLGAEAFSVVPARWREVRGLPAGLAAGASEDCGCVHALPLSRAVLPSLFSASALPGAMAAWSRARGAVELAKLLGGGKETRTYREWVVQHFGEPAFEHLYAPYCRRRFGDPAEVTVNVARLHHAAPGGRLAAFEAGPAARMAEDLEGVEVVLDADVTSVATGRVSTRLGDVEGDVFVDAPPQDVVAWLGAAAPPGVDNEVSRLSCRHAVEVTVKGGASLPFVTHVAHAPFGAYRLVRHGLLPGNGGLAGHVSVQFAADAQDAAWSGGADALVDEVVRGLHALGATDAEAAEARVQRVEDQHPVWSYTTAARLRQYHLALAEAKIVPVGRAGLFAPVDGEGEIAYLTGVATQSAPFKELYRRHVEPPVVDDDGSASLTDFVQR